MVDQGIKLTDKDGVVYATGFLDEYADFDAILSRSEPLVLNMEGVLRINSVGIRNFLKFLNAWGPKSLEYQKCTADFIDQLNMIPAIGGINKQAVVSSLYVPLECDSCDKELEQLSDIKPYKDAIEKNQELPHVKCPECGDSMNVLSESFFVFLER